MNRKKERLVLVLAAMAAMPAVSLAAEPPVIPDSARTAMEAGRNQAEALMRQNEWKDRQRQISQTRTGESRVENQEEETPSLNIPETEKVMVKDFTIDGQDIFSEDTLKALLADKKGALFQGYPGRGGQDYPLFPPKGIHRGKDLYPATGRDCRYRSLPYGSGTL